MAQIAFAVDVPTCGEGRRILAHIRDQIDIVKVGLELYLGEGQQAAMLAQEIHRPLFLDLKLHDIPATVAGAIRSVARVCQGNLRFLTVHGAGGIVMLREAQKVATDHGITLLAVTLLTSLNGTDLQRMGVQQAPVDYVQAIAQVAQEAGISGFVCSPNEVAALRRSFPSATLVVPGIRPAGSDVGDQARVATPQAAVKAGADVLVIGRPIRDAKDPTAVLSAIVAEINADAVSDSAEN